MVISVDNNVIWIYERGGGAALLLAYSLSEFLIRRLRRGPYDEGIRPGLLADAGILLFLCFAATAAFLSTRQVMACAGVCLLSTLLDLPGSKPANPRHALERYLAKQALMAAGIWSLWRMASPEGIHPWGAAVIDAALGPAALAWLHPRIVSLLLGASAYLFMIDGGTRVVRGILDKFPVLYMKAIASLHEGESTGGDVTENAGEWIGILERIITLTFVFTNSYTAIAFALTAKSIARFRELENKSFAEYYLLGTVGSVAVALGVGLAVKLIGNF